MKKGIAILLLCSLLLCLCACSVEPAPQETKPTEPGRDYSAYAGIVHDNKTWYDTLLAMPIASPDMTERELRQLCADAFRINQTFTWTPTTDISYSFTLLGRTSEVVLPKGIAYSGLYYFSPKAVGNVWKALEYYDHETGAMDIEAMNGESRAILSSACARSCEWAWGRISNSTGLETMDSYSQYSSRVVPIGPYNYTPGKYSFASGNGTLEIIALNGNDIMCQSYANMQTADGVYSSSSYHVMMCASDPVVVKNAAGTIDPNQSYVLVFEQDAIGSKTETKNYLQENGVTMRPLGTVDNKYTFQQLLDKGYVPFTIPELAGTDPVEVGDAWIGKNADNRVENGADITLKDLRSKTLGMNYALCVVYVQVKDAEGNSVAEFRPHIETTPFTFSVPAHSVLSDTDLAPYADGNHTVTVSVRMANGELKEALTTTLKQN